MSQAKLLGFLPVASWLSVEELIQLADLQRSIWRHDLPLCGMVLCSISYSGHSVKLRKHEPLSRSAFSFDDLGTTPHVVHHPGRMPKRIRITPLAIIARIFSKP